MTWGAGNFLQELVIIRYGTDLDHLIMINVINLSNVIITSPNMESTIAVELYTRLCVADVSSPIEQVAFGLLQCRTVSDIIYP